MAEHDPDQQWFDAVAGRPAPGADETTQAEAQWLRQAVAAVADEPIAGALLHEQARIERLVNRARAEGILDPRAPSMPAVQGLARPRWRRPVWLTGAAGALVALSLVGGVVWYQQRLITEPDDAGTPTVRAGATVQRLTAPDPEAMRERLVVLLRAAGAQVQTYERLARLGIDAELPHPVPQALVQQLQAQGVYVQGSVLIVEIEALGQGAGASR